MRPLVLALLALSASFMAPHADAQVTPAPGADGPFAEAAALLIEAALADSLAYDRMAEMGDRFGHRLSGSQSLEDAIDWVLAEMEADGLGAVRGQPVLVPAWIRGNESAVLVTDRGDVPLTMLGLGGSEATPPEGVEAPVLVVSSFDDLAARADEAAGRIVLFNVPFTSYGRTVQYRVNGASEAAKVGAVASLVRSVGPGSLDTPHTGTMGYEDGVRRIPHAALTIEGAERLQRMQDRGETPVVRLSMESHFEADRLSRNVIAEVRGRERPDEVVVLGGHIDSWDVGQGMVDDAGGCVIAWEAVRLMHALGLRPRRTVRVVMWTNEENGLRGGEVYRDSVGADIDKVQLAIESDSGVFEPVGFGYSGSAEGLALLRARVDPLISPLLADVDGRGITEGGGGADIGPLMRDGVPGMSVRTANEDYFLYHHTPADTADKLDPGHMARATAALAVLAYVAAEMPERIPHGSE